ncbi:MAG: GAF domain-containing protein [Cyclobacteriaceae bacterium]|nr:GAF domain-containing protein [Cyclobacteriaceae bacterium]
MKSLSINQKEYQKIFQTIKQNSDRIMDYALAAYFLFGVFISFFYDTYWVAFGVGGLNLLAYYGTKALLPNRNLYQYVLGGVLAVFAAQFIYQMHGLFEMHFFVFVGSTLLITYQNWRLQIPLILIVVIHHGLFAYLQYLGNKEIYFTQLEYMDLQTFMFHGALAAVIVAICGYWAFDLEKRTIADARNKATLEQQLVNVERNIAFAEQISSGNLTTQYELADSSDELGKALISMRDNLLKASEKESQEKFITIGLTQVADVIRNNPDSLQKLADDFVRTVTKYMNMNQAALFLLETENDEQYLNLVACYAYDRKKFLSKKINVGEGLVGQCFLERDVIYMTKVPQNYVHITSGLGDATPDCIILIPLMTSDEIVGVLEMASFKPLDQYKIDFIKKACENIASSIISSRVTEKMKRLLAETQQQTEEMRAQEEEMRQNMEELQATQEEMRRKEAHMQSVLEEARQKAEHAERIIQALEHHLRNEKTPAEVWRSTVEQLLQRGTFVS